MRVNGRCHCGAIEYEGEVDPPRYSLRLGCLDQRHELRPTRQQWCDSALPWLMDLTAIEQVERP